MTVTFYGFAVSGRVIRECTHYEKKFPTPDWGASAPTRESQREDLCAVHRVQLENRARAVRGGARCGRYLPRRRVLMTAAPKSHLVWGTDLPRETINDSN